MARPEIIESYVEALHQEIDLILPLLDKDRPIAQIHYGAGSPTAIPVALIKELMLTYYHHSQPSTALK